MKEIIVNKYFQEIQFSLGKRNKLLRINCYWLKSWKIIFVIIILT